MINKEYNYAIVGASNNTEKYGFKVLNDLKNAGYTVFPINQKESSILGLDVYKNINEISEKIDVVVFVVPPVVAERILKEVYSLGIKKVWMQPGSESDVAIKFCESHDITCVHNACVMVEKTS